MHFGDTRFDRLMVVETPSRHGSHNIFANEILGLLLFNTGAD